MAVGIASGFAVWLLEVLLQGLPVSWLTLFTVYVPIDVPYAANRLMLLVSAVILTVVIIFICNRRERWTRGIDAE